MPIYAASSPEDDPLPEARKTQAAGDQCHFKDGIKIVSLTTGGWNKDSLLLHASAPTCLFGTNKKADLGREDEQVIEAMLSRVNGSIGNAQAAITAILCGELAFAKSISSTKH